MIETSEGDDGVTAAEETAAAALPDRSLPDRSTRAFVSASFSSAGTISYARESIVTVLIGSDLQEFSVPEGLLKAASEYFSNALSGRWHEAETKTFELPEENVAVFQLFVHYLYHGVIKVNKGAIDVVHLLIEAWLFGERRGAVRFQNAVMSTLVPRAYAYSISLDLAALVFAESLPGSNLRRLVVNKWVYEGPEHRADLLEMCEGDGEDGEIQPKPALEFALEVVKGLLKTRPRPPHSLASVVEHYLEPVETEDNDYDSDMTESIGFPLFD